MGDGVVATVMALIGIPMYATASTPLAVGFLRRGYRPVLFSVFNGRTATNVSTMGMIKWACER